MQTMIFSMVKILLLFNLCDNTFAFHFNIASEKLLHLISIWTATSFNLEQNFLAEGGETLIILAIFLEPELIVRWFGIMAHDQNVSQHIYMLIFQLQKKIYVHAVMSTLPNY